MTTVIYRAFGIYQHLTSLTYYALVRVLGADKKNYAQKVLFKAYI